MYLAREISWLRRRESPLRILKKKTLGSWLMSPHTKFPACGDLKPAPPTVCATAACPYLPPHHHGSLESSKLGPCAARHPSSSAGLCLVRHEGFTGGSRTIWTLLSPVPLVKPSNKQKKSLLESSPPKECLINEKINCTPK